MALPAMVPPTSLVLMMAVCLLGAHLYLGRRRRKTRIPDGAVPLPGPKGLPFLGQVHKVPPEMSWLKFYDWSKEYGPIYQMELFGSVHVWISSEEIAHDLLSRRAAINSDRPTIPNLPDNRTSGDYLALAGHNETWKRQRKLCHHLMTVSDKGGLHMYPSRERDRFLYLMAHDPGNYIEWVEQFTARTVSRLCWGSPHTQATLRETTFGLLETISPAGALPNIASFLGHLPTRLSPWQKKEMARHKMERKLFTRNVSLVKAALGDGHALPSFTRTFLEDLDRTPRETEAANAAHVHEAMYVVGQMAIAGALTIGSPIQSFFLAMCHYPEWLTKMQAEIDMVLGGRYPQWEDREKLPLLRAVVKEIIRWRPPVPTGIPHASERDDVYNGYFIPKGATIHAFEWGITRNETMYPQAEAFNPDRWLNPAFPTYKEPLTKYPNLAGYSQFGFGHRTCQGVPIVDQDLFLSMGGLAWAFDIRKKLDTDGKPIPVPWNKYSSLLIAKPVRFQFDCILREGKGRVLDLMASSAREMEEEDDRILRMGSSSRNTNSTSNNGNKNNSSPLKGSDTAPSILAVRAPPPATVAISTFTTTASPVEVSRAKSGEREKEAEVMSETSTLASGTDSDGGSLGGSILVSSGSEISSSSEPSLSAQSSDSEEAVARIGVLPLLRKKSMNLNLLRQTVPGS